MADLASYNKHMIERSNKKHREGLKNVEDDRKDEFYRWMFKIFTDLICATFTSIGVVLSADAHRSIWI